MAIDSWVQLAIRPCRDPAYSDVRVLSLFKNQKTNF